MLNMLFVLFRDRVVQNSLWTLYVILIHFIAGDSSLLDNTSLRSYIVRRETGRAQATREGGRRRGLEMNTSVGIQRRPAHIQ